MSSLARAEAGANAAGGFVYGLLLVNGTLIAGMYAFAKVAGEHGITPLGLLTWQLLFAAIVIGLVAVVRGDLPALKFVNLRYAAIAGVLGITGPNLVTFAALKHVPAGLVGVITALSPALTYAIATLFSAERFEPLRAAGVLLGLAGVMAILLPRGALPDPEALPWAAAAVIAPLLLAGGNVFRSLAWPPGLRPLAAATLLLAIQALVLVPVAAVLGEFEVPRGLTGAKDLPLFGAGVLTAAFYLGAFELQKRGGAIVVGQIGYVITVSSLLLGALVFGERYPLTTFLAVAVVVTGIMLANRRPCPDAVKPLPAVPAMRSHNGCTA
ncbi:MAG: DMT family transporter [Burkholderiales bacterium]|nr:DMT family transporter [Burkholderiales bacterium]